MFVIIKTLKKIFKLMLILLGLIINLKMHN